MHPAQFYKTIKDNIVQCRLCNHFCLIKNNQVGTCRVRKNKNGQLYSLVYGQPAALNIDPIEKKPFYHFQPGSLSYSLGTLGCNLACANCQNYQISQTKNIESKIEGFEKIRPEKIIEEAIANDCKSIAYTYNEPTVFIEYALEIMKLARLNNLKNVWVSNGFMTDQAIEAILPCLDAINVDLKSIEPKFYQDNCQARLEPILENLKLMKKSGLHLEITTLIIPGLSDDPAMLDKMADFIVAELGSETPWHISKFSSAISWRLKNLPDTSDEIIYQAYESGRSAGLKYVYAGNIPGDQRENTYCPKCRELAISRFGYEIERFDNSGRCAYCDKSLDIIE